MAGRGPEDFVVDCAVCNGTGAYGQVTVQLVRGLVDIEYRPVVPMTGLYPATVVTVED